MTTALHPYRVQEPIPVPPAEALAIVVKELDGVLRFPSQRYSVRVEIRSWKKALTNYVIACDRLTGTWSCGCGDWINRHGQTPDYHCKHLEHWVPYLEKALELQALAIPQPDGVWF